MIDSNRNKAVTLQSHFGIVFGVLGAALVTFPLVIIWHRGFWIMLPMLMFGLFLILQTKVLKIKLNSSSFSVYRQDKLLRQFPYDNWLHWRLIWPSFPILLYFREKKSIHFLPVIFSIKSLRKELDGRLTYQNYQQQVLQDLRNDNG